MKRKSFIIDGLYWICGLLMILFYQLVKLYAFLNRKRYLRAYKRNEKTY
jgi:hypothetical protein